MTVIAWILVGLLVIGSILYALGAVLAGIAQAANALSQAISGLVAFWLGRRRLGVTASIPHELARGSNPLPRTDPDSAALTAYRPKPECIAAPSAVAFNSVLASVFREDGPPAIEIDVTRVGDILSMPAFKPYEPAFSVLSDDSPYPQRPPARPPAVAPPPAWTPWSPTLGEPSFSPPLWTGWLTFLNGFVVAGHRDEQAKVDHAIARKAELLDACQKRNVAVAELAKKAHDAFELAVARQE